MKKNDPQTATIYTLIFSFIFLIPFSGLSTLVPAVKADPTLLAVALVMGIVTGVGAQYLFAAGLDITESGKAAIYGAAEPIVGTLIGIFLFHEESNFLKIAGIAMVIAAMIIIGRSDSE